MDRSTALSPVILAVGVRSKDGRVQRVCLMGMAMGYSCEAELIRYWRNRIRWNLHGKNIDSSLYGRAQKAAIVVNWARLKGQPRGAHLWILKRGSNGSGQYVLSFQTCHE
jgi:hypothetical protein